MNAYIHGGTSLSFYCVAKAGTRRDLERCAPFRQRAGLPRSAWSAVRIVRRPIQTIRWFRPDLLSLR